ncbi:MAG: phenylalanine--tRNA ligase subunit beta, partial [Methylobacter sp.]
LRRCGLRSLGPVVDVTNYVLIELGQPLHAFDADLLAGSIHVRWANEGEDLSLLNGQTVMLDQATLVIADERRALALAGVMGGSETAVSAQTQNIFLECAFFSPQSMAGKARTYGLHTDSSHRFERGVDPYLQQRAIERATQLIVDIAGGSVGSITEAVTEAVLPQRKPILLRRQRVEKMLGLLPNDQRIVDIFQSLGMKIEPQNDGWQVTPPGFRFDIAIEADLIEEIARIYGYNNLPNNILFMRSDVSPVTETSLDLDRVKDLLVDRGYQEAITYSFVDESIQLAVAPGSQPVALQNPISSEMSVMRTTLWCGLLKAALHNLNRQHNRVRLFETGLRFVSVNGELRQEKMVAGLATGSACVEQWGMASRKIDFFDMKADIEAIFLLTGCEARFIAAQNAALHPGQTADILTDAGEKIGTLGMLHPNLENQLGFDTQVFLFELNQDLLLKKRIPAFTPLSKFPSVRRDLALIVEEEVTTDRMLSCIHGCKEATLQDIVVFDVYRGKGVEAGHKSVALSLTFQDHAQTLTDSEIDAIFSRILDTLKNEISAKLRD